MAKQTKITRFGGGKVEDLRTQSSVAYSVAMHFNIRNEHRLVPYRSLEPDESHNGGAETTEEMGIARTVYVNGNLFGYGRVSDVDTKVKIYEKNSDLLTSGWVGSSSGAASAGGTRNTDVFFPYKNDLYGFNNNGVWSYETNTNTFNESDVSNIGSGHSVFAEPVLHPDDGIAYFFADNEVHRNNAGTWSGSGGAITVPSSMDIVSGAAFGNYLVVGARPNSNYGTDSVLFFWDRDTSQTVFSEQVQFSDRLAHVANLQGSLIAVGTSFDGTADSDVVYLNIRDGRTGRIIKQYVCQSASFAGNKFVKDDTLYFVTRFQDVNGEVQQGVWAVKADGTLVLDQLVAGATETDTVPPNTFNGIFLTAQTWWICHNGPGDGTEDFSIDRTGDAIGDFDETSIYESIIFTGGDSSKKKHLLSATLMHEPLSDSPSDEQVTIKYRTDNDIRTGGAWNTIETNTLAGDVRTTSQTDSDGSALPEYNEIQFRLESTGGAVITGLKFVYDDVEDEVV